LHDAFSCGKLFDILAPPWPLRIVQFPLYLPCFPPNPPQLILANNLTG
jgi:hypothetical protein